MIADDEPALRVALADLLEHEETVELVGAASDADEAIELAIDGQPHVALIDVKMPAGGGPRAAREIRRMSPDTRVIALSAFEDRPTVLEMLRAGAVGYLVKGSGVDKIVDSISEVARGGTTLSTEVVDGVFRELSTKLLREEDDSVDRSEKADRIRRFIAGEDLRMVFQPIVDLLSRRHVGVEALARFAAEPHRTPDLWFAEAAGLALGVDLELVTIRAALDALPLVGSDAYLSVNASHRTVMHPDLPGILGEAAGRIVVEITEHERIEEYDPLLEVLDYLRAGGVRIAIDDAGAGYSSLRHALRLSPDIMKLDISLTRGIDHDRGKRALASSLISFGDEMGVVMIAEGIETDAELRALVDLGVPFGQGFLMARPESLGQ
jgi:EAL domain-containing protein (putative c-di-GMP-specific phosphodiesterase class I)/ActR/RegA family two-component response regulator